MSTIADKLSFFKNDLRRGWLLWNILMPLFPVLISITFATTDVVYSGFLSYCYALLAISWYLFYQHLKKTTMEGIKSGRDTRHFLPLIFMFVLLIMLLLYNYNQDISEFLNRSIYLSMLVTGLIILPQVYFVNIPMLERQEAEEEEREKALKERMEKQQETRDSTRKDAQAIVEEELNESNQN